MFHFKKWMKQKKNKQAVTSMDNSTKFFKEPAEKEDPSSPCTTWFNPIIDYTHSLAISCGFKLQSSPYITLSISVDGSSLSIHRKPLTAKAMVTVSPDTEDAKDLLCEVKIKEMFLYGILSINVNVTQFSPIEDLSPMEKTSHSYQAETLFSSHQIAFLNDPLGYECPDCTTNVEDVFSKLVITISTPYLLTPDGRKVFATLPPRREFDQTAPLTQAFLYALTTLNNRTLYIPLILEFEMEEKVQVTLRFEDAAYKDAFPDDDGFITLTYKN